MVIAAGYPVELECDVLLVDGTAAHVRPIRPSDADALVQFHEHLCDLTVYRRFFGVHPHLQRKEIEHFSCVDYRDRLALVAELDGRMAGVARYDREPGTDRAEVAFVVADEAQGLGLGSLLLEHLAAAGRRRGLAAFFAETLAENRPMLEVFHQTGFVCAQHWGDGIVDVSFPIGPTDRYLAALDQRDVQAVHTWRPASEPHTKSDQASLGIACRSEECAADIEAACAGIGFGPATTATADGEPAIDVSDLLAAVASAANVGIIVVEPTGLLRPRRFVQRARRIASRIPVVALLPGNGERIGDTAPRAPWREICAQAGVSTVDGLDALGEGVRRLLMERQTGGRHPAAPATLIELVGCDPARARAILDRLDRRAAPDGPGDRAPDRLGDGPAAELLGAYGITVASDRAPAGPDGSTLVVADDPALGLCASVLIGPPRRQTGSVRLLPLTDRDADDLLTRTVATVADRAGMIDTVLRATRLVDDQPDVWRLELGLRAGGGAAGLRPAVWIGPLRSTDDDPFVRRRPGRPHFSGGGDPSQR